MTSPSREDATELLSTAGLNQESSEGLMAILYDELRDVARRLMNREGPGHTLQPTALVNELYLKLIDQTRSESDSRPRFMAIAARAMRQILISHAVAKQASKRGGGWTRQPMTCDVVQAPSQSAEILELDDSIKRLAKSRKRVAEVVVLRYFGGMSLKEIGSALEVTSRTVADDWDFAKAWLSRDLKRKLKVEGD